MFTTCRSIVLGRSKVSTRCTVSRVKAAAIGVDSVYSRHRTSKYPVDPILRSYRPAAPSPLQVTTRPATKLVWLLIVPRIALRQRDSRVCSYNAPAVDLFPFCALRRRRCKKCVRHHRRTRLLCQSPIGPSQDGGASLPPIFDQENDKSQELKLFVIYETGGSFAE